MKLPFVIAVFAGLNRNQDIKSEDRSTSGNMRSNFRKGRNKMDRAKRILLLFFLGLSSCTFTVDVVRLYDGPELDPDQVAAFNSLGGLKTAKVITIDNQEKRGTVFTLLPGKHSVTISYSKNVYGLFKEEIEFSPVFEAGQSYHAAEAILEIPTEGLFTQELRIYFWIVDGSNEVVAGYRPRQLKDTSILNLPTRPGTLYAGEKLAEEHLDEKERGYPL